MTNLIVAATLNKIYGSRLHVKTRDGADATIHISPQPAGWPRMGAEAYGLKTELEVKRSTGNETIPAFLKIFRTEVREREQRTRLLIDSALARKNDFFFGIPFGWLGHMKINNIEITAHFTRMIRGPYDGGPEDFGRLRTNGKWVFDKDHRYKFAAELAVAVAGLERAGIVHGDISPGNILVGSSSSNNPICILCDYDGFYNSKVPRLPRKNGSFPCRPLGSPGYQYPDLISAIKADVNNDADIWVQTDRFALGVAICELIAWSEEIEKLLEKEGRTQLLPDDLVESRDLSRLPQHVIKRFPKGFELLNKAMHTSGPQSMPSPEDWLRVLGFDDEPWIYRGQPIITVFRARGTYRAKEAAYRVTHDKGSIPPPELGVGYAFVDKKLEFLFAPNTTVKRRRDGRLAQITAGLGSIWANPKDVYHVGAWQLEIADEGMQASAP